MREQLSTPNNIQEIDNASVEIIPAPPEVTEEQRLRLDDERAKAETARAEAVGLALKNVQEATDKHTLESLMADIDFSDVNKYSFSATANHHKAQDGQWKSGSSRRGGHMKLGAPTHDSYEGNWVNPTPEASTQHQVVEKVGIRQVDRYIGSTLQSVPRKGLLGKMGFKQQIGSPMRKSEEPGYVFDYSFSSPSEGSEDAMRAGHYNGQAISLSVELKKEQATQLSDIIAENPKAARQVLDSFVRSTGDYGAWNAELYDDTGNFHDPDERYDGELLARDVRPNYAAIPNIEPQVVGLIGKNKESEKFLPAA